MNDSVLNQFSDEYLQWQAVDGSIIYNTMNMEIGSNAVEIDLNPVQPTKLLLSSTLTI